jgi:hypothetical protein
MPILAGRTAIAEHRQVGVLYLEASEWDCRIITSIDDACMHPRTINSLACAGLQRGKVGQSGGRTGGKGWLRRREVR